MSSKPENSVFAHEIAEKKIFTLPDPLGSLLRVKSFDLKLIKKKHNLYKTDVLRRLFK